MSILYSLVVSHRIEISIKYFVLETILLQYDSSLEQLDLVRTYYFLEQRWVIRHEHIIWPLVDQL